jgi:hypothetical protein
LKARNAAQGNPPNLRINTVAGLVVGCEDLRTKATRKVVLDARLLAPNKSRHGGRPWSMSMSMSMSTKIIRGREWMDEESSRVVVTCRDGAESVQGPRCRASVGRRSVDGRRGRFRDAHLRRVNR